MDIAFYRDLAGKHALVTGGASGLGAAFAQAFQSQHTTVSILDLMDPQPELGEGGRLGATLGFERCDLRQPAAIEAGIAVSRERFGPIDILINNVARDDRHTLAETDSLLWDDLIAVNLRAAFLVTRAVVPDMIAAGTGAVVNVSSNCFLLGLGGYPAYVTAKAGIWGMTKALARELGPNGIRVNCMVPGWVMTERQRRLWVTPEAVDACLEAQCLRQTIAPVDIANACLFLASTVSRMMTGQMLVIDGGRD